MTQVHEPVVTPTGIDGLVYLSPKTVTDARGTVRELFRSSAFAVADVRWKQMNLTRTERGALRGLHGEQMTKLVGVVSGTAFAAWVDARRESPTFGHVETRELSIGTQVLVPPGVCNGFQAISDGGCEYLYCFDAEWRPGLPGVMVNPLDPALGIAWPLDAIVSDKDRSAPLLSEL